MTEKKFGALSSSVDPQKLSATIQGATKLIAGILITFGVSNSVDMNTVYEQIAVIVPAVYSAYGASEVIFGILRKVAVNISSRLSK